MQTQQRGNLEAIASAAAFGTIPLFSIPVLNAGMPSSSVLVYRFAFGCLAMLLVLGYNRKSLHISYGDGLRLAFMALLYTGSAMALITGYRYLPSGVATTLVFSYPVFTALLNTLFFHQRISWAAGIAIGLAVVGVALLSGFSGAPLPHGALIGVGLELLSGLSYALYMVVFPHLRIRQMGSLKVNFYIFFFTMLLLAAFSLFSMGTIYPIQTTSTLIHLVGLGLIPTALSNVTLVMAMKHINTTTVATLGAFEPITAMLVGIAVFGEPFSLNLVFGFVLILVGVVVLVRAQ